MGLEQDQPPHLAHCRAVRRRVPAADAARQPRRPHRELVFDQLRRADSVRRGARLVGPPPRLDQVSVATARWMSTSPEPVRTFTDSVSSPSSGPPEGSSRLVMTPDPVTMSSRAALPSGTPTSTAPLLV